MAQEEGPLVREIASFESLICQLAQNPGRLVVVDFFGAWCKPCKMIAPAVEKWASQYRDVTFYKVDTGEPDNEQAVLSFDIKSMPTFKFIWEGETIETVYGNKKDLIEEKIKEYRNYK